MSPEVRKYAFIDALRGYAIVLVVLVHSSQAVQPESDALQALMAFGERGVQLFFIVSAITLCMSWHARSSAEQSPVRNFYVRRAFRIAPMFWIATAFYLALYGFEPRYAAPNGLTWYSIPMTALFVNGYSPENINALVPGGWSIAVEVNFYLILPALLAIACSLPRSIIVVILAMGLGVLADRIFGVMFSRAIRPDQSYIIDDFLFLNFFNQLPVFATGIAACRVLAHPRLSRAAAVISAVLLLGVVLAIGVLRGEAIRYLSDHLMLTAIVFALSAIALFHFPARLLVNRPLQYLGKMSFSLYLVHFAVLFALEKLRIRSIFQPGDLSSLAYFALVLVCASQIAVLTYSLVERPGVLLGARVIRHLESRNKDMGAQEAIARGGGSGEFCSRALGPTGADVKK